MTQRINGANYGLFTGKFSDRVASPQGVNLLSYALDPQRSSVIFDDFNEDTINLDRWALTKDASGTDYAIAAGAGGTIAGITHAASGSGVGINGINNWYGDLNCGMEVRMKLSTIASGLFEVGFADTATDFKDPLVTDVDTPTLGNGGGDVAAIVRDLSQTLKTAALVTVGSTPYAAAKSDLGTYAPAADTYFTARVQLIGNNVFGAIFDATGGLVVSTSMSNKIEGGTAVRPYVNVTATASTAITSTIDYIKVWQDRA